MPSHTDPRWRGNPMCGQRLSTAWTASEVDDGKTAIPCRQPETTRTPVSSDRGPTRIKRPLSMVFGFWSADTTVVAIASSISQFGSTIRPNPKALVDTLDRPNLKPRRGCQVQPGPTLGREPRATPSTGFTSSPGASRRTQCRQVGQVGVQRPPRLARVLGQAQFAVDQSRQQGLGPLREGQEGDGHVRHRVGQAGSGSAVVAQVLPGPVAPLAVDRGASGAFDAVGGPGTGRGGDVPQGRIGGIGRQPDRVA